MALSGFPAQQERRLAALRSYDILDTPAEAGFDDIALLASQACETPVALVSFVSVDRQWFKARVGFDERETPLDRSVCAHVVKAGHALVFPDLTQDERTSANPLVVGPPFIRFYAGAPLIAPDGEVLGALCVIDEKARPEGLTERQLGMLSALARQVVTQLELRRLLSENQTQSAALAALNDTLEQKVRERTRERGLTWDVTLDMLGVVNRDGFFEESNPAWQATLGWSEAEIRTTKFFDFIHPDDVQRTEAAWDHMNAGNPVLRFENRYRTKAGGWKWLSWVVVPEGEKFYGSARDITGEKDQEAELARAAQDVTRLAQLFEQAPGFMALLRGPEHVFELANPAYERLVGRSDLGGKSVREAFPDIDGQGFFDLLDRVFASGEAYSTFGAPIAFRATSDGPARERLIDFVYQPIKDTQARVTGIFVQGSDVTDRAEADAALRESEARLREIAASERSEALFRLLVRGVTDYAIYMLDPEGRVSSWNLGAQRIKGYLPEEIVGEHFSKFYTEEDRAAGAPQRGLEVARREGRFETEGWRLRKDGTRFRAHVVIDAIPGDGGEVIGFAKITRDITERQQTQLALEQAREALFQSQKLEAIGQLTGGIAHDFNNLLMAVLGSLELAQKRLPDDPQINRLIGNAIQGARRGATLTQRMLAFARRQELKRESVDLAALVFGMEDLLEQSLGQLFSLNIELAPRLPAVASDPAQLESALLNLVINARDAMPRGGVITVSAAATNVGPNASDLAPGDYVRLAVVDQGEGMSAETLARATEPFFTTKGIGKGTGLGLAMIHGLTSQSGGALRLKSTLGVGSEVELWLPVAGREHGRAAEPAATATGPSRPLTVLAVDDDALVLLNTVAMLEDLGHTVLQAGSGDAALQEMDDYGPIDLMITDHAMPGMTGAQLAQTVAAARPGLPIILATGYAELPPGEGQGLARLAKPFGQKQLAEAVDRATKPRPPPVS